MKLTSLEKHALLTCELSFESFYKNEFTYKGSCSVLGKQFVILFKITPPYRTTMEAVELLSSFEWCTEDLYITVNGKKLNTEVLFNK